MKICLFYHSLVSDWNHGNAHFLRGVAAELLSRGHDVMVYEPKNSWSLTHLLDEHGTAPLLHFREAYPQLQGTSYEVDDFEPIACLKDADLVIVHEWTDPRIVAQIGAAKRHCEFVLLFHDTHHRLVTDPAAMQAYDLSQFDGVLAYGEVLRELYLRRGLTRRAWIWHEAADTRVFYPRVADEQAGDLVWIGNWGDEERSAELREFLIEPVRRLGLKARVYGVRYPAEAKAALADAGIEYAGWLPNFSAPEVFARYRVTVHVPRRPYVEALRGIPTIRFFEALACGIPLLVSPWRDTENLFTAGRDYLPAETGSQMTEQLAHVLANDDVSQELTAHGVETIRAKHTCAHRVDELLSIFQTVAGSSSEAGSSLSSPSIAGHQPLPLSFS